MISLQKVEGLQRYYKGRWVSVKLVNCSGVLMGQGFLAGELLGVTKNGYGKVCTLRNENIYRVDKWLRIKEKGEWVELGGLDIARRDCFVYQEFDCEFELGLKPVIVGCRFENQEQVEADAKEGKVQKAYSKVYVESIEGFWGLVESSYVNYVFEYKSGCGVYIDESVSLEGVSVNDLRCLGSSHIYISGSQAEQVNWGKVKQSRWKLFKTNGDVRITNLEMMVYVSGSDVGYKVSSKGAVALVKQREEV